jgi:hypothetical protein
MTQVMQSASIQPQPLACAVVEPMLAMIRERERERARVGELAAWRAYAAALAPARAPSSAQR